MTTTHHPLKKTIETVFQAKQTEAHWEADPQTREAILEAMTALDQGTLRVAEKINGSWQVHAWVKQAVLLYFGIQHNAPIQGKHTHYYDKIPSKFRDYQPDQWQAAQLRVVPPAMARFGAYIGPRTVLMPSYVNIGAYIDEGTMVDTWATVGSCAQIGKNVHLSGGVGIGGVLEPLQANPTIIEDGCFIGARSEVVEGVIVEEGAVLGMGVYLSQSTKIYDRASGEISYGRIPAGAVVVPGTLPAQDGSHSLACAVIVKRVDAQTRAKVGINALLRESND